MNTTAAKPVSSVAPWGIEIYSSSNNANVIVQSIPGCRLRGQMGPGKVKKDPVTGDEYVPGSGEVFGRYPSAPGQQLHVNPAKLSYRVIDPLNDDPDLLDRIQRKVAAHSSIIQNDVELRGVPNSEGKLDKDRIKTLCREMVWLVQNDMARVVKGPLPDMEDIEGLPGDFLLNPGSQVPNSQPRYEKDYDAWVSRLNRMSSD